MSSNLITNLIAGNVALMLVPTLRAASWATTTWPVLFQPKSEWDPIPRTPLWNSCGCRVGVWLWVCVGVYGLLSKYTPLFVAITWCCLGQGGLGCAGSHRFTVPIPFATFCGARVHTFHCITVTHYKVTVSLTACYMIVSTFSFHFESHSRISLTLSLSLSHTHYIYIYIYTHVYTYTRVCI